MLCGSLDGRGFGGRMDTCLCMTESLHCSSETVTRLLIGYTPIQNVFGVKKIKRNPQVGVIRSKVGGEGQGLWRGNSGFSLGGRYLSKD